MKCDQGPIVVNSFGTILSLMFCPMEVPGSELPLVRAMFETLRGKSPGPILASPPLISNSRVKAAAGAKVGRKVRWGRS